MLVPINTSFDPLTAVSHPLCSLFTMPGMPSVGKLGIKQPGFYFPPGEIFSSVTATTAIYSALFQGAHGLWATSAVRESAEPRLIQLFEILVQNAAIYDDVGGGLLFWEAVTESWGNTGVVLQVQHVHELATVYAQAREVYGGPTVNTDLTNIVDRWNAQAGKVAVLSPTAVREQLLARSNPKSVQTVAKELTCFGLDVSSLRETASTANTDDASSWPPLHLDVEDRPFLNNSVIRNTLGGVALLNNASSPAALPAKFCSAISCRLFLVWLVLRSPYSLGIDWALFMVPIAFLDVAARGQWNNVMTASLGAFSTLESFLAYANSAFTSRGKTTVAALLTPWFITRSQVMGLATVDEGGKYDVSAVLNNHPLAARIGSGLVLRAKPDRNLQIVLFDPTHSYAAIRAMTNDHLGTVDIFRQQAVRAIREWAEGHDAGQAEVCEVVFSRTRTSQQTQLISARYSWGGSRTGLLCRRLTVRMKNGPRWASRKWTSDRRDLTLELRLGSSWPSGTAARKGGVRSSDTRTKFTHLEPSKYIFAKVFPMRKGCRF